MFYLLRQVQKGAYSQLSLVGLKAVIILLALGLIFLALSTNNKWLLAGELAYEVLP
jgi:hypothetical protein